MAVPCKHWRECGIAGGGCCDQDHYQRPSVGVCMTICTHYDGPARGLGDTIAKVTKAVGIKPCGGCTKRQMKANKAVPYG